MTLGSKLARRTSFIQADRSDLRVFDDAESAAADPGDRVPLDTLARSVAHTINNALASLLVNLDGAVDALEDERQPPSERMKEALALLTEMRASVGRIVGRFSAAPNATARQRAPPRTDPLLRTRNSEPHRPPNAGIRVLVIDDDESFRAALQRCLHDYDLVVLDGARNAFARLAGGERFDVILCDLMMPEMTGMDLYEEILLLAPEQARRMVFMTGGAVTTRARDFVANVPNLVMEKPFPAQQLRSLIRSRTKWR